MAEAPIVGKMEVEVPKRKRGRPRKSKSALPIVKSLPQYFPVIPHTPVAVCPIAPTTEMQHAYQVLKTIMKLPKIRPFLERPDKNLFGLHNYHKIVKNPMWLSEVSRKFIDHEYNSITEFLMDITLMLKNCYKFWGPYHKFTKLGLRIEVAIQNHLKALPEHLQQSIPDDYKEDPEQEPKEESSSLDSTKKEFVSKIMLELEKEMNEGKGDESSEINVEEMWKWEEEVFGSSLFREGINTIFLLPEIGQFLKLSYNVLDIDEITQFEIERMLLMPRESHTLATIMTTMLCPYAVRGNLFLKPVMCYEVWSEILKRKVDHWYNIYFKLIDPAEVFEASGIEPHFWVSMGEVNPLYDCPFHELSLFRRAWLLKALCTYTFHSNKRVENLFNTVHEDCLRPAFIWEEGNHQFFTLFAPEIRLYRQRKVTDIPEYVPTDTEDHLNNPDYGKFDREEFRKHTGNSSYVPPKCLLPKQRDYCLVASTCESLDNFCSTVKKKKAVYNYLQSYEKEKHDEFTLLGLQAIYSQWNDYKNRLQCMVNYSFDYWISKNIAPMEMNEPYEYQTIPEYEVVEAPPVQVPITPIAPKQLQNSLIGDQPIILGKRVHKKRVLSGDEASFSDQNNEEGSENSDVSDWEEGNIKKKSKRKKRLQKPFFLIPRREGPLTPQTPSYPFGNIRPLATSTPISNFSPVILESRITPTGVTILRTRVEEKTKRSVVAAAVAKASSNIGELENGGNVLTISLKSGGSNTSAELSTSPPTPQPLLKVLPLNTSQILRPSFSPQLRPVNVEGKLSLGTRQDGTFGYRLVLPDGGLVTLTNEDVSSIRAKNGGVFPEKVSIPMLKYV